MKINFRIILIVAINLFLATNLLQAFGLIGNQAGTITLPPDTTAEWWFLIMSEDRDEDGIPSAWAEVGLHNYPELEWCSVASANVFRKSTFFPPGPRSGWDIFYSGIWFDTRNIEPGSALEFVFAAKSEFTGGNPATRIVIVTNPCTLKVEPYKISDLSAVEIDGTSNRINLSWSDPNGGLSSITHYTIYRQVDDSIQWQNFDSSFIIVDSLPITVHTFIDSTGLRGMQYWYVVIGYDSHRRVIAISNNTKADYEKTTFSLLTPQDGSKIDSLRPFFDWEDYPCSTYTLYYDTINSFSTSHIISGITQSEYLPFDSLLDKKYYYWKVCAIDNSDTVWCNETGWSFGIDTQNLAPGAFSLLTPANNDTIFNTTRPTFKWQEALDPGDFVNYSLLISYDSLFTSPTIIANIPSAFYLPETSLLQDTTIYWKVKAIDKDGTETMCSDSFFEYSINFNDPPTPFSKIFPHWNLRNGDTSTVLEVGTRPTFDWEDAIDPEGKPVTYILKYSTDSLYLDSVVITGITESQYTPSSDLQDNRVYFWDVWATDGSNVIKSRGSRPWGFVVNAQNEIPDSFNVTKPATDDTIETRNPLLEWEYTSDPDPNDIVVFKELWISKDSNFTFKRIFKLNKENLYSHSFDIPFKPAMWHPDTTGALDGKSWWVSLDSVGGYDNEWFQIMRSPSIDLSSAIAPVRFSFKHSYCTEGPWFDGGTIRISTDGGRNFEVIIPSIGSYDTDSLYAFRYHGEGYNIPAFCGDSSGWIYAEFDLSSYIGDTIILEIIFASDEFISSPSNPQYYGWRVDSLLVYDANDTLLFDDAGNTKISFYPLSQGLNRGKTYYWKVKAIDIQEDPMGGVTYSQIGKFTVKLLPALIGNAYLDNDSIHSGIKVLLKAKSATAVDDSTFTDSTGHYAISVNQGIYDVILTKDSYSPIKLQNMEFEHSDFLMKDIILRYGEIDTSLVVSGAQFGTFDSNYNYIIWDSLRINNGDTLIIEPGVILRFDSAATFQIHGLLKAEGTQSDSIYFTSALLPQQPGDWDGIHFYEDADSNCIISYSFVKYATIIGFSNTQLVFNNNTVVENSGRNIFFNINGGKLTMMQNILAKNS